MKTSLAVRMIVVALAVTLLVRASGQASAAIMTIKFQDSNFYWSDYSSTWQSSDGPDNSKDAIGDPDFANLKVHELQYISNPGGADDGDLSKLDFKYVNDSSGLMLPGDVFLDLDNDKDWDWVIRSNYVPGTAYSDDDVLNPTGGLEDWSVYALKTPLDYSTNGAQGPNGAPTHPYVVARDSNGAPAEMQATERDGTNPGFSGLDVRDDHPVQLRPDVYDVSADDSANYDTSDMWYVGDLKYLGTATFSGWEDCTSNGESSFTFDNASLDLGAPGLGEP